MCLKEYFEKVDFEQSQQTAKKAWKITQYAELSDTYWKYFLQILVGPLNVKTARLSFSFLVFIIYEDNKMVRPNCINIQNAINRLYLWDIKVTELYSELEKCYLMLHF